MTRLEDAFGEMIRLEDEQIIWPERINATEELIAAVREQLLRSATSGTVSVNDIVQIGPQAQVREVLRGALAVVDEVKPWGVLAWVPALGTPHLVVLRGSGLAYVRLATGDFERTGGRVAYKPESKFQAMLGEDTSAD